MSQGGVTWIEPSPGMYGSKQQVANIMSVYNEKTKEIF